MHGTNFIMWCFMKEYGGPSGEGVFIEFSGKNHMKWKLNGMSSNEKLDYLATDFGRNSHPLR